MYAETGLLFPCFQNFSQDVQQFEDLCKAQKSNASICNLLQASMISEYDIGGEGDLFKAPEPIIEEPIISVDPVTAAISMISCGEDGVISRQALKASDIESLQKEQLLSEVLYECEKELLEQAAMEMPLSEVLEIKIPALRIDESLVQENKPLSDSSSFQKSVSSECLSSREWLHGPMTTPNFLDFPGIDFVAAYGMRRAFSEGDIKTLGNGNGNGVDGNGNGSTSLIHSPHDRPMMIGKSISEERKEKLSRYRTKKTKRNFGRKIKYACRKALADSQPRIRGRFAKTEEFDVKRQ